MASNQEHRNRDQSIHSDEPEIWPRTEAQEIVWFENQNQFIKGRLRCRPAILRVITERATSVDKGLRENSYSGNGNKKIVEAMVFLGSILKQKPTLLTILPWGFIYSESLLLQCNNLAPLPPTRKSKNTALSRLPLWSARDCGKEMCSKATVLHR